DRPAHEFAAAIRAASLEQAVGAVAAERALERADNGVVRIGGQIPVAAFATRPERKHGRLPARWRVLRKQVFDADGARIRNAAIGQPRGGCRPGQVARRSPESKANAASLRGRRWLQTFETKCGWSNSGRLPLSCAKSQRLRSIPPP